MAHSTRPQLASAPNMAALTSDEQMMLLATVFAVPWSAAPVTQHSSRRVAPSPSPAIWRQSQTVTLLSALQNAVKSAPGAVISALPARPFASTATMSFVDVSPSMLTMLNVSCTSPESAACSMAGLTAQSVVRKTSMVARFGWIMPEPLAMPPIVQVLPPAVNCTAISLRVRVGGHDALGRLVGVVAERGGELRQAGADGREIERLADHARGRDDDVLRRDVQLRPP